MSWPYLRFLKLLAGISQPRYMIDHIALRLVERRYPEILARMRTKSCAVCNRYFPRYTQLLIHLRASYVKCANVMKAFFLNIYILSEVIRNTITTKFAGYRCKLCGYRSVSINDMVDHILKAHESRVEPWLRRIDQIVMGRMRISPILAEDRGYIVRIVSLDSEEWDL